jgi:adenine-specific DNA-methyltransferase
MTKQLQKLELTWIGKGHEPHLEPRILIEDSDKSYGDSDTENILIHGDNLLALKALEQSYSGRIKCICIDPPYNTGSAFEHYNDGIEHSLWLDLMSIRLKILQKLMSSDGTIWIAIDDNEVHYLKVLCDEIFGRQNFVTGIAWRSADSSNNDSKKFSIDHNTILVYSRNPDWLSYQLERTDEANAHYRNPDNDPNGPWFPGNLSSPNPRPNLRYNILSPKGNSIKPPANGWRWKKETVEEMIKTGELIFTSDETKVLKKTYLKNQKGLAPSSIWFDIDETGHNRQAKYELMKLFPGIATAELFKTPKPERLIAKILRISTKENDFVLDSFLGSGTTAAVAHKMNRRWIGVELGEHAVTHCLPRLRKVVSGEDRGGVTEIVNWKGGGGFKYYTLAPSLIQKDKYGSEIINPAYNPNMLAAAMAKQEGFHYSPDEGNYWKQGFSSEKDFIFTTTQFISVQMLDRLAEELNPRESILVCCKSYARGCSNRYNNITIKKIPQMLLGKCEFGKDDYSLNIVNLPNGDDESTNIDNNEISAEKKVSKFKKKRADDQNQPSLFK